MATANTTADILKEWGIDIKKEIIDHLKRSRWTSFEFQGVVNGVKCSLKFNARIDKKSGHAMLENASLIPIEKVDHKISPKAATALASVLAMGAANDVV